MLSLAKFSIRRPRAALATWIAIAAALSLVGLGVDNSISPSVTAVSGTQSRHAQQLADQKFGPSQLVPILLEGPRAQLDKQGPKLVKDLVTRPHTRALSAWDVGAASAGLRPNPTAAMIVVAVDRTEKNVVRHDQAQIEKLVARDLRAPVRAYVSGQPSIDRALNDQSVSTLEHYAVIAFAVLFVLLLIGLRAPFAAGLVTIVAGTTTLSAFGLMALLGKTMSIDTLALATGAIAGLSRGACFSLVMLDRVHRDKVDAEAVGSTGRALLFAGTVMIATLLLTDIFGVTEVLATLGIAAVLCTAMATCLALLVIPATSVLFGRAIRWSLPAPAILSRGWDRLVALGRPIVRHPLPTGALAAVALLALAVPALAAKTGPQDIRQLPTHNQARIAFTEIARVMGAGYPTPYNMVLFSPSGPITSNAMLTKVNQFERRIAHDPAVASVVGPGAIYATSKQLSTFGPQLKHSADVSNKSKKDLVKLIAGLGQAGAGSKTLQSGLQQAESGAQQLHGGSGQAQSGAAQLHAGLAKAKAGSDQLSGGLNQALSGAQALKVGAAQALAGSSQLLQGISLAQGPAQQSLPGLNGLAAVASTTSSYVKRAADNANTTAAGIGAALKAIQQMPATTPELAGAKSQAINELNSAAGAAGNTTAALGVATNTAAGASGLAHGIAYQAPGLFAALNMLHDGASQLQSGLSQLRDGNAKLAAGIDQLANGGGQLRSGLGQLTDGAGQLQAGLALLTNGAGQLASGLAPAPAGAGQLATGLGQMQAAVVTARGQIPSTKDLETLMKQSPGMFTSGYFVLAAIDGAPPADRNQASFALNLTRGGNAGQILITGRYPLTDPRAAALGDRLRALAASFAKQNHVQMAVGGPSGSVFEVTDMGKTRLPLTIIGPMLGVALLLGLMLRSILIPSLAILCAGLVTAADMGVMQLLFGGTNPPLGGPGNFDPISTTEIVAAAFGATLVYVVVLLTRTRDYFVATGEARTSLMRAMRATVASTTGMATITLGVVIPFMFSELQPVRRIAVAAGVSVLIVGFVVVPVLLPAVVSLVGRLGWWPTHGPRPTPSSAPPARTRRLRVPSSLKRGAAPRTPLRPAHP